MRLHIPADSTLQTLDLFQWLTRDARQQGMPRGWFGETPTGPRHVGDEEGGEIGGLRLLDETLGHTARASRRIDPLVEIERIVFEIQKDT